MNGLEPQEAARVARNAADPRSASLDAIVDKIVEESKEELKNAIKAVMLGANAYGFTAFEATHTSGKRTEFGIFVTNEVAGLILRQTAIGIAKAYDRLEEFGRPT